MDIFPFVCFSIWHHITVHLIMTAWSLIVLRAPEDSKATQQIYRCYDLTLDNRCLATALKNSNHEIKGIMGYRHPLPREGPSEACTDLLTD